MLNLSTKNRSSPPSIFLMIQNKMCELQWHPYIGEIHTKNLVYEKGGVIKHIKAPAIVKAELLDL